MTLEEILNRPLVFGLTSFEEALEAHIAKLDFLREQAALLEE
jgi:hypothetical protein